MEFTRVQLTHSLKTIEVKRSRQKKVFSSSHHKFRIADGNRFGDKLHFLGQFLHDFLKQRRQLTRGRVRHQHVNIRTGFRS